MTTQLRASQELPLLAATTGDPIPNDQIVGSLEDTMPEGGERTVTKPEADNPASVTRPPDDSEEQQPRHRDAEFTTATDFEEVFTRYRRALHNFIFRLVDDREQAYDLTQDTFVEAYSALLRAPVKTVALTHWLFQIASHNAYDNLRRRRLITWFQLSTFSEEAGVGAGLSFSEKVEDQYPDNHAPNAASNAMWSYGYSGGGFEQRVVDHDLYRTVIESLPRPYAVCLLLHEWEGFSCEEMTKILGLGLSATKMRLKRARSYFIRAYKKELERSNEGSWSNSVEPLE